MGPPKGVMNVSKKHKSKKHKSNQHKSKQYEAPEATADETGAPDAPPKKLRRKEYEAELEVLQGELVAMQEWVKATGAKVCIVFEGRDTAGKGGTIKRDHRAGQSACVPGGGAARADRTREKSQMYLQRYMAHFPAAGEVVIFDRSWYNRAGVEPVMGFCTRSSTERFLAMRRWSSSPSSTRASS